MQVCRQRLQKISITSTHRQESLQHFSCVTRNLKWHWVHKQRSLTIYSVTKPVPFLATMIENVSMTSERLNKIQQQIGTLEQLPDGIERQSVKDTLKKLNAWKGMKSIQKLLRDYTDGAKAQLETADFVAKLVKDSDEKNLVLNDSVKPSLLSISLSAMLLSV